MGERHNSTNTAAYCDCDELDCTREHAPLSPSHRAAVDGKVAIQKMRLRTEGLSEPIRFALDSEVWGFVHKAYRLGIHTGELRADADIANWLRASERRIETTPEFMVMEDALLDNIASDIERGEHRHG